MPNHSTRIEKLCIVCSATFSVPRCRYHKVVCSATCYHKSRIGSKHTEETKEKQRIARLANNPMKGKKHTEETRAKMRAASSQGSGDKAINWKGGRTIDTRGYILIYAPDHPNAVGNYVFEHRLVMEKHLGRYLSSSEEVHHKNEDRQDNRIENLSVMSKGEHARLHRLEEVLAGTWHRGNRGRGKRKKAE